MPSQKVHSHFCNPTLFPPGDGGGTAPEVVATAGFDLDEDRHVLVPGHDVDFAISGPVTAFDNFVPTPAQLLAREIFSKDSKRLTIVLGHGRKLLHNTRPSTITGHGASEARDLVRLKPDTTYVFVRLKPNTT